ncbi:hypothetical protein [Reichenbachiella ulvae]|uniref:Cadherin domain-containing protein n=1 Tax=Reichenbachiella ulvae TaxID=2980104 RepID=A0ABT3CWB5_9BACT|nr:hypothetical protein [Reichenbachiella ulvae]MCV9387899.1 hypothetical protein [Reichenbachiella ulvae]
MKTLRLFYYWLVFGCAAVLYSCADEGGFTASGDLSPLIAVNGPVGTSTVFSSDGDLNFNILVSDDNGLTQFTLFSEDLGVDIDSVLDGTKLYNFKSAVAVSSDFGSFPVVVTATDNGGNTSVDTLLLTKEQGASQFIYAVGDVSWNDWDPSKAMLMSPDEEDGWYAITLYSDGDDDGVKFIGQLDWAPNNWGLVDTNDPGLGMVNDDSSGKILLDQGYSIVRFNPTIMQYTVELITEELPTPNGQFHVMGCGFQDLSGSDIDLCWDPSKAYPMDQDAKNPYLYRATIGFSDAVDLKFNGNQSWDDLDWGFPEVFEDDPSTGDVEENKLAPEGNVLWTETAKKYGADWKFFNRQGTYELILDEYLGKAQIRRVN